MLSATNRVTDGRERLFRGGSYSFVLDRPAGVQLLAFVVTSQERGLDQVLPAPVQAASGGRRPSRWGGAGLRATLGLAETSVEGELKSEECRR